MLKGQRIRRVEDSPLRLARQARGWTLDQAAGRVGVTKQMWSLLERGRAYASPRVARKIAALMGVSFESLLNFGDNQSGRKSGKGQKRRNKTLGVYPGSHNV